MKKEEKANNPEPSKEENKEKKPAVDQNQEIINEISKEKKQEEKKGFFSHYFGKVSSDGFKVIKKGLGGILDEYNSYKHKKGEVLEKFNAYETVVAGSTDTADYYILLFLSCLIATIGLYQNSVAVIIGAMIVAPLMGPIFGFSAGVLWGSGHVIWEAFTTLLKGTLLVIAITASMTYFIPGIIITPEMTARCNPSLFDVMVALCCGFIGAYSFINKRVSSTIPGVAISVALMPPLCTIGIGLGLLNFQMARGAGMLFCVNLIGISLAACIVFFLVRLHPKSDDKKEFNKAKVRAISHLIISLTFLILVSTPLVFFMSTSISQNIEKDSIYKFVNSNLPKYDIYSLDIKQGEIVNIKIVLLNESKNDNPLTETIIKNIESKLKNSINKPVKLTIFTINEL